jgi:hypothetical protein
MSSPPLRCATAGRAALALAAGCGLVSVAGCPGPAQVGSVGPEEPRPISPAAVGRPLVQAGTIFSVRIDQPLDSYGTAPGTPFTATVVDPLRASDGRVLVPQGAKVGAVFVSHGTPAHPRVCVELRSIETVEGRVPLRATVRVAQHLDWAGPASPGIRPSYGLLERGWRGMPPTPSSQSAPPEIGDMIETPSRQVLVPRGALVAVMLVEPIVAARR